MAPRSITENILKFKNKFWLFIAIAIAFVFRVYRLGAPSLWNDEGTSVALAARSLQAIVNGAAQDIHPPLYYFLLHFWMPLTGQSEFAVRFLSAIAGVLVVVLTFRIARFFFNEEVANVAAFFSAFSPFQIYYSQETRMYVWIAFWAGLSVLAMVWMLQVKNWKLEPGDSSPISGLHSPNSRSRRTLAWLLYILATIAALYTHYFGVTVIVFENFSFAIWIWLSWRARRLVIASSVQSRAASFAAEPQDATRQSPSGAKVIARSDALPHSLLFWVIAQVICILAFLPWYLFTRNQLASWPAISEPFDLPTLLWRVLNVLSIGLTLDASASALAAIAFAFLFLVGCRLWRDAQTIWGTTLLMAWVLVPVLAMYVVSLTRPAYNPKFLLLASPPFLILAARGLSTIHPGIFLRPRNPPPHSYLLRYAYFAISVVAAVAFIPSLQNYYYNPSFARDDYRAILRFIDSNARAGDSILVDAPGQVDVVRYYRRGDQPLFLLPQMRPPDPKATTGDVDGMLVKTRRLFAIYYATEQSDPQAIVDKRLAERAFKARDEWHGNVRLAIYGVARSVPGADVTAGVRFGDEILLAGWQLDETDMRAGDILALTLNWRTLRAPTARYKVFVHLLDSGNHVIAQRDGEPAADTRATTTWRAGDTLADNYGVFIDPGTPPGDYQIEIGMYRADNGTRLQLVDSDGKPIGDHLVLGTVRLK